MHRKDPLLKRSHLGSLRNKPPRLPKNRRGSKTVANALARARSKNFRVRSRLDRLLRHVVSGRPQDIRHNSHENFAAQIVPSPERHWKNHVASSSPKPRFRLAIGDQIIRIGIIVLRVGEDGPSFARYSTDYRTNCHGSTQPEPISSAPGLASAESCGSFSLGPSYRRITRGNIFYRPHRTPPSPWSGHGFGRQR